jgi:hypothetical protein
VIWSTLEDTRKWVPLCGTAITTGQHPGDTETETDGLPRYGLSTVHSISLSRLPTASAESLV